MKIILAVLMGIVSFALPGISFAAVSSNASVPTVEWEYIRDASGRHFGKEITKQVSYDEDDLTSIYRLRKGVLTDHLRTRDKVATSDKAIWDMFVKIADKETLAKRMLYFATYEDPGEPVLGFVDKLGKKEQSWLLAVNANAARPESMLWTREMGIVILHEYGHLVTLSSDQIDKKKSAAAQCKKLDTYHSKGFGCTKELAYLNAFVHRFWSAEEIAIAAKARERDAADELYKGRAKDNYVSWYAATSPEDDIAESFVDFILRRKPVGTTEKEQKILFFYDYPELVKMRSTIRTNIESSFK